MNASIEIQNGVKTLSGAPVDAKYYNNAGTPYTNVAEVNSQIPSALRGRGLTVNVAGVEYWYKDGITDLDLVVKTSGTTDYSDLTNKPTINSVQLTGNKTAAELQLATKAQGDKADTALQSLPAGTVIDPDYTHTDNNYTDADVLEVAKIANKVDKVAGKSLIADTEITRLATVENYDDTNVLNAIAGKQPTLVSGTNIKTINSQSLLGSGDMVINTMDLTKIEVIESDTAPVNPIQGLRWLDTTSGIRYEYVLDTWVEFGGSGGGSSSGGSTSASSVTEITNGDVQTALDVIRSGKLSTVTHDTTITGDGTVGNPLSVATTLGDIETILASI